MKPDFNGRRALVTGAGKGIGREITRYLVDCNASVLALSRTEADLESLQEETGCDTICVDLGDVAATRKRSLLREMLSFWSTTPASRFSSPSWTFRLRPSTT